MSHSAVRCQAHHNDLLRGREVDSSIVTESIVERERIGGSLVKGDLLKPLNHPSSSPGRQPNNQIVVCLFAPPLDTRLVCPSVSQTAGSRPGSVSRNT